MYLAGESDSHGRVKFVVVAARTSEIIVRMCAFYRCWLRNVAWTLLGNGTSDVSLLGERNR